MLKVCNLNKPSEEVATVDTCESVSTIQAANG